MARSVTTVGGCSYDLLREGVKSYACDSSCLVDLRGETDVNNAEIRLVSKLTYIFRDLEIQRDTGIAKFYIGKTFIRKRRNRGRSFMAFDPMDPSTWKKNGISSRWQTHREREYGRDGLVVLTAVTRDAVPPRAGITKQEDYALALEQKLIHHFRYTFPDSRLHNETAGEGRRVIRDAVGYAVYVAFCLNDIENEEDSENNDGMENHERNPSTPANTTEPPQGTFPSVTTEPHPSLSSNINDHSLTESTSSGLNQQTRQDKVKNIITKIIEFDERQQGRGLDLIDDFITILQMQGMNDSSVNSSSIISPPLTLSRQSMIPPMLLSSSSTQEALPNRGSSISVTTATNNTSSVITTSAISHTSSVVDPGQSNNHNEDTTTTLAAPSQLSNTTTTNTALNERVTSSSLGETNDTHSIMSTTANRSNQVSQPAKKSVRFS